ncbi:MAG TPA: T9SS type A sorting domain-containing protein, partial [Caldithrix abyssi]|nr:T9SS type A sorting domain-containing protein [Caldithrix abyssi]
TVSGLIPQTPELSQNFPNPFNGITRIDFAVPVEEAGQNVSLAVYDIRGRLIRYLIDSPLVEGRYFALWDGRNQQGAEVSSGMYIYLLQVGKTRLSKRLTLLK